MFKQTDQLEQLIIEKHKVLEQLHTLSRYQLQLASSLDHVEDLMRVVAAKQTLIDQLLNLDEQLNPFRDQDPESRNWRNPADRQRVSEIARNSKVLLDELKQFENQSEQRVREKRDEVSAQLQASQKSTSTLEGYASSQPEMVSQFDLTSE